MNIIVFKYLQPKIKKKKHCKFLVLVFELKHIVEPTVAILLCFLLLLFVPIMWYKSYENERELFLSERSFQPCFLEGWRCLRQTDTQTNDKSNHPYSLNKQTCKGGGGADGEKSLRLNHHSEDDQMSSIFLTANIFDFVCSES